MNKINYLLGLTTSIILCASASAQDFYNGFKGPKAFQMDTYLTNSDEKTTGTIIPKLFTKNLDSSLTNMVLAVPNQISEKGIDNKGVNLGLIVEKENESYIGALGLFKDNKGQYAVLNPQAYATFIKDSWTVDLEGSTPISLKTGEIGSHLAATIGCAISEELRIGGSIIKDKNMNTEFKANMRIKLEKNNKYWAQLYVGKDYLGARLVANFWN